MSARLTSAPSATTAEETAKERRDSWPPRPVPSDTLGRRRHAEEVELAEGVHAPRMSSTTGRRFRAFAGPSSQDTPDSTSTSTGGPQQKSRRRGESGSAATKAISTATVAAGETSCLDNYGFRVTVLEKAAEDNYNRENALPASMLTKWEAMAVSWDSWSAVDPATKKKSCRRGIPEHLRGKVWQLLLGTYAASFTAEKKDKYAELKSRPLDSAETAGVIERDLDRTFPTHYLFGPDGPKTGQTMLRNILRAYANYNTLVGYCQGMGFLAATLLLQIEHEEDTFWAFCALMEKPPFQFEGLYEPGFPQLRCCFYVLENLLGKQSKKLQRRLREWSIDPSFFTTHWFMTAFSYYLNFGLVCRIWDMFLCEGWKPIYRVALALLLLEEKKILSQASESELLLTLKDVQEEKEPTELLKMALRVKFKSAQVGKLTGAFRNSAS